MLERKFIEFFKHFKFLGLFNLFFDPLHIRRLRDPDLYGTFGEQLLPIEPLFCSSL